MSKLSFQECWSSDEEDDHRDEAQPARSDTMQCSPPIIRAGMMLEGEPMLDPRTGKYRQRVVAIPVGPSHALKAGLDPSLAAHPRLNLLQPDSRYLNQKRSDSEHVGPFRMREPTSFDMAQEQRVLTEEKIVDGMSLIGDRAYASTVPDKPLDMTRIRMLPAVHATQEAGKTLEPIIGTDEHLTHQQEAMRDRHVCWNDREEDRGRVVDGSVALIASNHGYSETVRPSISASSMAGDSHRALATATAIGDGMATLAASIGQSVSSSQGLRTAAAANAATSTRRIALPGYDSVGHSSLHQQQQQPRQQLQQQSAVMRGAADRAFTAFAGGSQAATSNTREISRSANTTVPQRAATAQTAAAADAAAASVASSVWSVRTDSRVSAAMSTVPAVSIGNFQALPPRLLTPEESGSLSRAQQRAVSVVRVAPVQSYDGSAAVHHHHQNNTSFLRDTTTAAVPAAATTQYMSQGGSVPMQPATKADRMFRPFAIQPQVALATVNGTVHANVVNATRSAPGSSVGQFRLDNTSSVPTQGGITRVTQSADLPRRGGMVPVVSAAAFASPQTHNTTAGLRNVVLPRVTAERSSAVGSVWAAGASSAQRERAPDGAHDSSIRWQPRERHQPRESIETERNLSADDLLELQGRPVRANADKFFTKF